MARSTAPPTPALSSKTSRTDGQSPRLLDTRQPEKNHDDSADRGGAGRPVDQRMSHERSRCDRRKVSSGHSTATARRARSTPPEPRLVGYGKRGPVRVAIVSDVHGNLTAFDAVLADIQRRAPELVLHGGDLALMGAQPAEVIDRVRELGWPGVVGNTDEVLWRPEEQEHQQELAPKLGLLLRLIFQEYAPATLDLLGEERVMWLRQLPAEQRLEGLVLVHAAPGDLWRAPLPEAEDEELSATYEPLGTDTAVYGHIHRPYTRALSRLTVSNSGSVGMPWDGDPRASYLLIEDGSPHLVRVEYDVEREAALLLGSGYPDAPRLVEMRRRGVFVRPGEVRKRPAAESGANTGQ
jgi:putative phosphoesterase